MGVFAKLRHRSDSTPPTHEQAVKLLHAIQKDQIRDKNYDPNPNAGYNTPNRSAEMVPGAGML